MCKKQTSVSHSSTESAAISFDVRLRMDGIILSVAFFENAELSTQGAAGNRLRNSNTIEKSERELIFHCGFDYIVQCQVLQIGLEFWSRARDESAFKYWETRAWSAEWSCRSEVGSSQICYFYTWHRRSFCDCVMKFELFWRWFDDGLKVNVMMWGSLMSILFVGEDLLEMWLPAGTSFWRHPKRCSASRRNWFGMKKTRVQDIMVSYSSDEMCFDSHQSYQVVKSQGLFCLGKMHGHPKTIVKWKE